MFHRHRRGGVERLPYARLGVAFLAALFSAQVVFRVAGSVGLAGFTALLLSVVCYQWLMQWRAMLASAFIAIAVPVFLGVALYGHAHSQWVEPSFAKGFVLFACMSVSLILVFVLNRRLTLSSSFNKTMVLVSVALVSAVIAVATGGYKFKERMGDIDSDIAKRAEHWGRVIGSAEASLPARLFGNGVGVFPARYVYHFPEALTKVGSFSVVQNATSYGVALGPGEDLAFGQRVPVISGMGYQLSVAIKADAPGKLALFLCERNLIFANNFHPNCKTTLIRFSATDGQLQAYEKNIHSGGVGEQSVLGRWPTTLYMKNLSEGVIDVDDVVFARDGENMLQNGSFEQGLDHWFFFNDFAHLPWHIKNTFLQAWYDTGWLGLAMLLGLLGLAFLRVLVDGGHSPTQVLFFSGVAGVCIFGFFGSPLDSARVSWLFYCYLFAAALLPSQQRADVRGA